MTDHPSPAAGAAAPTAILRPCARPGCGAYAAAGGRWCSAHTAAPQAVRAAADRRRGTAASRGYDHRWQRARLAYLAARSYRCAGYAVAPGATCLTPASVVDHIVPHRGDSALFWAETNWQPLCKRCHDRKTATEDGGFRGAPAAA